MSLPLEGIRILDFTRFMSGPFATMLLGDLGADVIKIEPPGGEDTRGWGPPWIGTDSAYFVSVNRNKRSIIIDLKKAEII
jgi:crotonobetainyl-CoA:carnitine CoA-transferase CaiB-like acyl-CoA transferase